MLSCLTTYVPPGASRTTIYGVFVPLVLLAVPLYDTVSVIIASPARAAQPDGRRPPALLAPAGAARHERAVGRADDLPLHRRHRHRGQPAAARRTASGRVLVFVQTLAILAVIAILESGGKG